MANTVQDLVKLGEEIVQRNKKPGIYGNDDGYISGVEYEEWIARVIFFMEDNKEKFPSYLYEKVTKAADRAVGNGEEYFNQIAGVLKVAAEREKFQK